MFISVIPPPQGAKSCAPLKTNLCSCPGWKPVNHAVTEPPRDFYQLRYVPKGWILSRRLHTGYCRPVFPSSLDQRRPYRNTVSVGATYKSSSHLLVQSLQDWTRSPEWDALMNYKLYDYCLLYIDKQDTKGENRWYFRLFCLHNMSSFRLLDKRYPKYTFRCLF